MGFGGWVGEMQVRAGSGCGCGLLVLLFDEILLGYPWREGFTGARSRRF